MHPGPSVCALPTYGGDRDPKAGGSLICAADAHVPLAGFPALFLSWRPWPSPSSPLLPAGQPQPRDCRQEPQREPEGPLVLNPRLPSSLELPRSSWASLSPLLEHLTPAQHLLMWDQEGQRGGCAETRGTVGPGCWEWR